MTLTVSIPEQLKTDEFRFIKLRGKTKLPQEPDFTKAAHFAYDDPALLRHLAKGYNYGILGGQGGFIEIDADHEPLITELKNKLPKTFTIKTPHGGFHKYLKTDDPHTGALLDTIEDTNGDRANLGHVTGYGRQVVGPGCSIIENGKELLYTIEDDAPVAEIKWSALNKMLGAFLITKKQDRENDDRDQEETKYTFTNEKFQNIMDVLANPDDFVDDGDGRYRGFPVFSSHQKTGYFLVYAKTNTWYSHKDEKGGHIPQLVALQEGIITIKESLKGEKWWDAIKIMEEKYGIKIKCEDEEGDNTLIEKKNLQDTDHYLVLTEKKDGTKKFAGIKEKLFADDLTGIYHFKTLRDTEEVLYYEGGYYHYEGEAIIGAECERIFGRYTKTRNVAEILNHIRRATYIKRNKLNTNKSFLPLQNGLFDLTTHSLNPFDPNVLITYKLPVEYNPDADCPSIKKFIEEILNPEDIPIIQEYFGYALLPAFPAHKSLWLYGIGRNGKSQIISLLSKMLGDENTVSVPIEEFDGWHRFSTARLFGKLLNVTSEPGVEKPLKSGLFKKVIGGDRISAEIKGKQRTIDFVNFSKFVVLGNIFPQVTDPSLAFWDRLIVVEFPNTFVDNFVPEIAEKLIKEDGGLSGFFNWCLDGLKRLEENGFKFTTTKNTEEMKIEFEKLSNPVMAFIKEECVINADKIIPKGELYNAYKDYCGDGNYKITGKAEFSKQIGELRGVDGKKARSGGKVTHCWIGMSLHNENDDENVDVVAEVDAKKKSSVNAPLLLTPEIKINKIKDRADICNVNNGNNVNTPLICVCKRKFDTIEVLQQHQSKCKEFQAKQDKEARKEITKGENPDERVRLRVVKGIIVSLELKEKTSEVSIEQIINVAEVEGMKREQAEEAIEKLKLEGIVFSPKKGVVEFAR